MGRINALAAEFIDSLGYIDLPGWTGIPLSHLPANFRESGEPLFHCSSAVALIGDPNCDPRSGGIAGVKAMSAIFGLTPDYFRSHILPKLDFIRWLNTIPVSNVLSLQAASNIYHAGVHETRRKNLFGDVSSKQIIK